jgi:hypothetical protein
MYGDDPRRRNREGIARLWDAFYHYSVTLWWRARRHRVAATQTRRSEMGEQAAAHRWERRWTVPGLATPRIYFRATVRVGGKRS